MKSKHSPSQKKTSPKKISKAWSLIGVPDHQGVIHVGGRIGAAQGPREFRRLFAKMKGRDGVLEAMRDHGDTAISGDISANHRAAAEGLYEAHSATKLSVLVGGSHDHGYSHLLGLRKTLGPRAKLGCINIDAHLDVRRPSPIITSGSPFFLALESGLLDPSRFIEFGIQSHCNSLELWQYVEAKKCRIIPFEELRHGRAPRAFAQQLSKLTASCDAVAISLDLDAAAAAFAPGVSAPQAEGFSGSDIIEMMEISGKSRKVASLGIFELNPVHDLDHQTARLACTAAYHFIAHALRRR